MKTGAVLFLAGLVLAGLLSWLWPRLQSPPSDQAIARELLAEGRPDDAILLLEDPLWRGVAEYRAGRYARALGEFFPARSAIENYNLGTTFARLEDWNGAVSAYQTALRLDPEHADARHNLEIVLQLSNLGGEQQQPRRDDPKLGGREGNRPQQAAQQDSTPKDTGDGETSDDENAGASDNVEQTPNSETPGELSDAERTDQLGTADAVGDPEQQTRPTERRSRGAAELRARESAQAAEILLRNITDDPERVLRMRLFTAHKNRQPEPAQ